MARYCFLEDKREVFAEACLRGWLAAILAYPHCRLRAEVKVTVAQGILDDLRSEVCCIPDDEYIYRCLTISGFVAAYVAFTEATEREIARMVAVLRPLPYSEAMAFLRDVYARDRGLVEVIDAAYAQFLSWQERGTSTN